MKIEDAHSLSDAEIVDGLPRCAGGAREATADLVVHLAEFDRRRLYLGLGFPTLWSYCLEVLRLSEDAASNRIQTARLARRYPAVVPMLEDGRLSLSTARMLAAKITDDNHVELFTEAAGKTRRQVEALLGCRFPSSGVPTSVRRLPWSAPAATVVGPDAGSGSLAGPGVVMAGETGKAAVTPRPMLRAIAPDQYQIRFTATGDAYERLRLAQDLLASNDVAEVYDRALTLLVDDLLKKKFALGRRPGASRGQEGDSRNIPADVRRAVAIRDRLSCAFVGRGGHRCGQRRFLHFHHVIPYTVGGKPTVENIQLRCRAHNQYEADEYYGPMRAYDGFTRPGTGGRSPTRRTRATEAGVT